LSLEVGLVSVLPKGGRWSGSFPCPGRAPSSISGRLDHVFVEALKLKGNESTTHSVDSARRGRFSALNVLLKAAPSICLRTLTNKAEAYPNPA
ncbi:hypothetical protein CI238_12381, partial [Colletotrichum incanum]